MAGKKIRGLDKGIVGTLAFDAMGSCRIVNKQLGIEFEIPTSAMCKKPVGKVKKMVTAKLEDPTAENLDYLNKKFGVTATKVNQALVG